MAGIRGGFVCTGLIDSSVCCCVKTSELENVCFIGCQDIFGALHFIASDLVFGCMKVFYHRVLSYLLDPVDLCCVLWVSVLMILNLTYLSHVSCLRSMYYWGFSWALCLVTLCKFPGFSYSCHLKF
jgi:hypothetical protein